jgi:uncharacterized membrane protein
MKRIATVLALSITLTACATARSIQPIVFQGPGFDHARYQADLADCYRMVDEQSPGTGSAAGVAAKTVGGGILGAVAGTVIGAAAGSPGRGAALGSAIGGTAGGVGGYAGSEREKRQVYHRAVTQCLALKGYTVMGATGLAQ